MVTKWTPQEKARIVIESLTTNIGTAEICRKYNLSPNTFYPWKEKFLEGGKAALAGSSDGDTFKSMKRENDILKRITGEIVMVNDALKKTLEEGKR